MIKFAMLMTLLLSLGACQSATVVSSCPPFPWPVDPVIDYMDAGTGPVPAWWTAIIKHGVECDTLNE